MKPIYIVLIAIAALFLGLLIFMIIRTILTKKDTSKSTYVGPKVDIDKLTEILQGAVRIPTITPLHPGDDMSSFLKYHKYLQDSFPEIFKIADLTIINKYSLIIKIEGTEKNLLPIAFLAHQDVVPATMEGWEVEPFSGDIKEGCVYGRGSQDMKCQMISALFAMETLLKERKLPRKTIYFCFGHDEESTGMEGAHNIAKYLEDNNIKFEFILDEGGTITDGSLLGIDGKIALIGTCDKGYADFKITSTKDGGHGASPKKVSSVDMIAKAITKLNKHPMKAYRSVPLRITLKNLAPYMKPLYKFLFVNSDILSPLLKPVLSAVNPLTNSILRTTIAFTKLEGSTAPNVIPVKASAVMNVRINAGETSSDVIHHIKKVIGKEYEIEEYNKTFEPTRISPSEGDPIFDTIKGCIKDVYHGIIVSSYPFIGATDSKHYENVSEHLYRFTPFEVDFSDSKRIHGLNERCHIDRLYLADQFFRRLIEKTCYNIDEKKDNTNNK